MQKDTFLSVLRTFLTLLGSFLVGSSLWHGTLSEDTWQVVSGALLTISSTIWGIADKSATLEAIQSGVRSVIVSIGGLLVAAGYITGKTLDAVLGFITAIIPIIQSYTSKLKIQQIHQGNLKTSFSGKVLKMMLFFVLLSGMARSQSIFKRVPSPQFNRKEVRAESLNPYSIGVGDSTWTGIRPIIGVAAFSEPGNQLMTGAGVGYQKLTWDYSINKWQAVYSVSILGWAAGSVSPGPQIPAFGIGPAVGLFNNLLLFGGGYDFTHGQWFGALSFGISLN